MTRIVFAILVCILGSVPALAQSSMIDLSKPMTGKSRYGINPDGSPLELGVPAQPDLDPRQQPQSGAAVVGPCSGAACGSAGSAAGGGSGRPKTEHVSGYTRKDGTHVGSYMRAPRRR